MLSEPYRRSRLRIIHIRNCSPHIWYYIIFSYFVKLDSSVLEVEMFKTSYYRHAYEYVISMPKEKYQGIICLSGDGITHEVVNAIKHRSDNLDIPIGVIPAGSGNGLAKNICETSKLECNPFNCSYIICKGQTTLIDLMEIETLSYQNMKPDHKKIYAFSAIAWGVISDIDLESEK